MPQRASLPEVRDLAFDQRGELWIATAAGLYRWSASGDRLSTSGRPERRALRGGESAPGLNSLTVSGSIVVVAGDAGVYWSSTGNIFQPLDVGVIGSSIDWTVLRRRRVSSGAPGQDGWQIRFGDSVELWLLGSAGLHRLRGIVTKSGLRILERQRQDLPRPVTENRAIGFVLSPSGEALALVYPDQLAVRALRSDPHAHDAAPAWRIVRPVLAPGALIQSLTWGLDRVMLSTDHGVFIARNLDAPFVRARAPVGTSDCQETQAALGQLPWVALCRSGVYASGRAPSESIGIGFDAISRASLSAALRDPRTGGVALGERTLPDIDSTRSDPPLEEIRRRAFERAGLSARRSGELWSGLRRRALWPELEIRFVADFDRDRHRDYDQSFVSGDTRDLVDYGRDRSRRLGGTISLDWDLGGVAYPLESVDLSRELRQVVSLRDDVADEINQLYFERQRLRVRLADIRVGRVAAEPGEETRLGWRAQEIDAGLDAWTGGWIAEWRRDRSNRPEFRE